MNETIHALCHRHSRALEIFALEAPSGLREINLPRGCEWREIQGDLESLFFRNDYLSPPLSDRAIEVYQEKARTAETHRSNLMHKLDLHTQAELIRYALRRGIVPIEE